MLHFANKSPNDGLERPGPRVLKGLVDGLNAEFADADATDILSFALSNLGSVAVVSSFGAESVVLLDLVARVDPATPILFVDTQMLFAETLDYQQEVAARLGLDNVLILSSGAVARADPDGALHRSDPDACCALRKTAPLQNALRGHDAWISGRKQFQSGSRRALQPFEAEAEAGRIKINPLARWSAADIRTHMEQNALPRHPLVARGYPSIGCAPCTTPVAPGEDPRSGRWRGTDKQECGIHFENGKAVRIGAQI